MSSHTNPNEGYVDPYARADYTICNSLEKDIVVLIYTYLDFVKDYFHQWNSLSVGVRTDLYNQHFTHQERDREYRYYRF